MQGIANLREQADLLARLGRYEDAYIVHAAEGETVVPLEVLNRNPALKEMLFKQMEAMGLEPERYIVGNELNSINPATGQPEFFLKSLFKGIKSVLKVAAPLIGAVAGSFIPGIGPIIGPAIGGFLGAKIAGYDTMGALAAGGLAGFGGYALSGSAAAAAGGYGSGASLGSSLFSGASQQGLGSLFSAAGSAGSPMASSPLPAFTSEAAMAGSPAFAGGSAAATIAPAGGAATAAGGSSIIDPIVQWAKTNPGLAIAGVAALASYMDQPKDPKQKYTGRTGMDEIRDHPGTYDFPDMKSFMNTKMVNPVYSGPSYESQYGVPQPVIDYTRPPPPVFLAGGGHVTGPGTGTSDSIPALLSDGEFVFTSKAVLGAGGGSRKQGARRMYAIMRHYEKLHG